MLINIDKKTNLLVDIGDKKPTQELIDELRKKMRVGRMLPTIDTTSFIRKSDLLIDDNLNEEPNTDS